MMAMDSISHDKNKSSDTTSEVQADVCQLVQNKFELEMD